MQRARLRIFILVAMLGLGASGVSGAEPLGTAFTYQGQLKKAGVPVNTMTDFQFSLWDADVTPPGNQVGATQTKLNVEVSKGLFTVQLDFGADAFNGKDARWLQIAARSPAGSGDYTTLSPRQVLTGVPFALQTRGITVGPDDNVGIGTTEPVYPLDVDGIIRTTVGIRFPNGTRQFTAAISGPHGVREYYIGIDDPNNPDPNTTVFTWTAPPGTWRVMAELWGGSGGGGGGGARATDPNGQSYDGGRGGGGGAGGYLRSVFNVMPGETYTVIIGRGGAGGVGGVGGPGGDGADAGDGEATQFIAPDQTILASAGGGAGGTGGTSATQSGHGVDGAPGAGGAVSPVEGIVRPGTAGGAFVYNYYYNHVPGSTPEGSVTAPHARPDYNEYFSMSYKIRGGYGGWVWTEHGEAGEPGDAGYVILHW